MHVQGMWHTEVKVLPDGGGLRRNRSFLTSPCVCFHHRDDLDLQVALLQWKGIPERKARQVLEDICEQHKSKVTLWNCCLPFCTRPKK